ncbi:hypothetical protein [Nocardia rhizosphaerae]|uniref:Uncharacterized protein n=1 Tax=Nocardia rhizosphaerae TaxID=1691571 RepID=A0ABV8L041_9NOCA
MKHIGPRTPAYRRRERAVTVLGYADTMFNSYQLTLFVKELAETAARNEREEEVVTVLREAAQDAINRHGYLWFSGD